MQAVNLLPLDARPAGRISALGAGLTPNRVLPFGGAIATAVVLAIVGLYLHERSVVHHKQATLTNDRGRLVALDARAQVVKDAQAEATTLTSAVNSIVSSRMIWDNTLADLARVLPNGVFLTTLTASVPAPAAAVAAPVATGASSTATTTTSSALAPVAPVPVATAFAIAGSAPAHNTVALVLDRLALLPWLSGPSLVSTTRQPDGTAAFNVSASIVGNGGH